MNLNFDFFNPWVEKNLGIRLDAYKQRQMQRRIQNLVETTDAKTLEEYADLLLHDSAQRAAFIEHLTINVTDFYRNKELFDLLEEHLLKTIIPKFKRVKIWSAACSIGSEPYTLAMILDKNKIINGQIVATDIDQVILAKARQGLYRQQDLRNLPAQDIKTYFTKVNDEYQVDSKLKSKITFKQHDLLGRTHETKCHVVVCRNVTIYFTPTTRDEVYQKLSDALEIGGILFTGATETINNPEQFGLTKIDAFIYKKIK